MTTVECGYVCKKCSKPSPMGVGYTDYATPGARTASESLTHCACGYSQSPESPVVTITHTHEAGTMVEGTARGDGSAEVLKACGWRWSRNLGTWYVPRSRDCGPKMSLIARTAAALVAAGFEVGQEIDTATRTTAEVESAKVERQADRVEALETKAAKLGARSDAAYQRATDLGSVIPFGQPVHGARDRAYRDKVHGAQDRAVALWHDEQDATAKAETASHTTGARYSVVTVANRIKNLEAEIRDTNRHLAGTNNRLGFTFKTDANAVAAVAKFGGESADYRPASGMRLERLAAKLAEQTDQLDYWQGVRAAQVESGQATNYSKETVSKGDMVKIRGGWRRVVRANAKTVACETGYSWTDNNPYAEITALVTAAEVEARKAAVAP